jgi:predicted phage tail protein
MSLSRDELITEVARLRLLGRQHRRISEDTESALRALRAKIVHLRQELKKQVTETGTLSPEELLKLLERLQEF